MRFEISFPDQPADEAGVLAQELRLALLRSGADPSKVEIVKDRADTMDLGSIVGIAIDAYHACGPIAGSVIQTALHARQYLEPAVPPLLALECAKCLYHICRPAHAGIVVETPHGTYKLSADEIEIERIEPVLLGSDVAGSDEHGD
jgi:hypothetical protein